MPSPQTEGYAVASSQTSTEDGAFNINNAFSASSTVSYEQIFSPISIRKDLGGPTPGFRQPAAAGNSQGNFDGGSVGPTLKELNPYFPTIFGPGSESDFMAYNDFVVMANETGGSTTDLNIRKLDSRHSIDTVRVVGLRGPLIISGWGFDIADRPVPAKGTSGNDQYAFKPEVVNNRSYWKTGPVHLMWDDERQVWAGGPQIVCGELDGSITAANSITSGTQFTVKILRASGSGGGGSLKDIGETITVTNRDASLEHEPDPDDPDDPKIFVIAIRLNYEWLPLWVGCSV